MTAAAEARMQLKAFVERIERLEEEKKSIADDVKDVYGEAKAHGFDTTAIRAIVRLRRLEPDERNERFAVLDTYMAALGMLPRPPEGDVDGELDRRRTEAGRAKSARAGARSQACMASMISVSEVSPAAFRQRSGTLRLSAPSRPRRPAAGESRIPAFRGSSPRPRLAFLPVAPGGAARAAEDGHADIGPRDSNVVVLPPPARWLHTADPFHIPNFLRRTACGTAR